jgi:hypothetical protein
MRPDVPRIRAYNYDRFKTIVGDAKPGYQFHHIAEQGRQNDTPGIDPNDKGAFNNSDNIVEIKREVHECINGYMSRKDPSTQTSPREDLAGKTLKEQFEVGKEFLDKCLDEISKKESPQESPAASPDTAEAPATSQDGAGAPNLFRPQRPPSSVVRPGAVVRPGYKPGLGNSILGPKWPLLDM